MQYPEDLVNKITCGNSLEVMKFIPENVLDGIIIDPPYGENQGYDGDETLDTAEELLSSFLRCVEPKMKRSAHIAIFWTMRNLDVCIDAVRSCGFTYRRTLSMYIPRGGARPYLGWLPRTQPIVIAQKYLPKQPSDFHRDMAEYLAENLLKSEMTRAEVARRLNCDSRLVMKWTRVGDPAWCLPTPRFYKPLKELLKLDERFDILLDRQSAKDVNGHIYEYKHDTYVVDNKVDGIIHPSQKPIEVLEHLVTCIAPEGGVILDGFSGSGTTAVACKNTGRNFIAIEVSEEYCETAGWRLE